MLLVNLVLNDPYHAIQKMSFLKCCHNEVVYKTNLVCMNLQEVNLTRS